MKHKWIIATLALSLGALTLNAQDDGQRPPGGPRGGGARGGPLMEALDANRDGELDAAEIANAAAAIKKLDKNNDGKISADELRPARPAGGTGNRPGGQGGPGNRPGRPPGQPQP